VNVSEAINKRRSIRSYKNQPVEKEKLDLILQAARLSPSARNQQIWKFVVVRNKEALKKLAHACEDQMFVAEADTAICCCALVSDDFLANGEATHTLDLSVAITMMMLQATDLELGTCWIGAFNQDKVRRMLRIPEEVRIVSLLAIGYPHFTPPATDRKPLSEIMAVENFAQPWE
jgi:nitroreductase